MDYGIRTTLVMLALAGSAQAQDFNIDFGDNIVPSATYGAGINQPGVWNAWNGVGVFSPVDLSGAPTGVLVSVSGSATAGSWNWPGTTGNDEVLIDDYLNAPLGVASAITLTLQNLAPGLYETFTYGWFPFNVPSSQTGIWNPASTDPFSICGGAWNVTLAATPQAWTKHRLYVSAGGSLSIMAYSVQLGGALNGIQVRHVPNAYMATYCTGKLNSEGCTPLLYGVGYPSAGDLGPYSLSLRGEALVTLKSGLLFYSLTGRAALPFQGGTLCVAAPLKRTPVMNSGGTPPGCNGTFFLSFSQFANGLLGGNPHPALLIPGTTVNCQWWARDSGAPPNNTQLSNALEFVQGY